MFFKNKNENIDHIKNFFKLRDGTQSYYYAFIKDHSFKNNLILHHGLGEHSERYTHLIAKLLTLKLNFFTFDARGHGKTKTRIGKIKNIAQLEDDLNDFLSMLEIKYRVSRPLVYAHSMGGLVLLSFLTKISNQSRISGVAVNAPALIAKLDLSQKIKQKIGKWIGLFLPNLILSTGLKTKFITRCPEELEKYKNDSFVHNKISIGFANSLLETGGIVLKNADVIKTPILITHGKEDGLVDYKGSEELFKKISFEDKQLIIYPNLYHETHNELRPERDKVLENLHTWLKKHLSK